MSLRADLVELGPDALMALSNPGFVKRAQKDIAEGRRPQIEVLADSTVQATYADGQQASLAPGRSLREARCTCPAAGLCRHRVTLVLAYQEWARNQPLESAFGSGVAAVEVGEGWSPAEFGDEVLASVLPPAALAQARRLAAGRPVVRLTTWRAAAPTPTAHLPLCSVRFFSRSSLAHARCDCELGGNCEHVAIAVWAFRQAQSECDSVVELLPHNAAVVAAGFDAAMNAAHAAAWRFLRRVWLDGSSQEWMPLDADYVALRELFVQLGWNWSVDGLDELRTLLLAQAARSSRFDPRRLLDVLAEFAARLAAAAAAAAVDKPRLPAARILGIGIRGEVALDHLKLVSLGLQCWSDDSTDGARVLFADPDTLAVTVLERSWPRESGQPGSSLLQRRVAGQSLRQLASAQVVTRGAKRRANGLIDISALARQTSVLPLSPNSWDGLTTPLRMPNAGALRQYLGEAVPDFVQPRQAISHVHVLPVAELGAWGWDAAASTLRAHLRCSNDAVDVDGCADDDWIELVLAQDTAAAGAVDVLAAALADIADPPRYVAGLAGMHAGSLRLVPLALLTARRAVVLQAGTVTAQALPVWAGDAEVDGLVRLLETVVENLTSLARQGLRHQPASAYARLAAQADALECSGLVRAAALMRQVAAIWCDGSDAFVQPLSALILLLRGLLGGESNQRCGAAGSTA
ncbi:MAG: SWIM zinc finger family protein [Rhodanobacteraceae bacterium]|nr:SWIM zinc finger family protein [Rhodanobacteraceae bacterium]